ncbi:endonuclease domain-containing protein [Tomitella fengzijianii]|uniref:DUF559 domain-containing protein n=1 Tax=Tomitella fengzijianii TaxID=2597660 RepID=A0A516X6U5_9ACTN|nr:DUF559 domain-containing protein [Tomitella fengzijianii]QDQ98733.1 DUF559 domain-containing protein [Tomitella fengzijianii]
MDIDDAPFRGTEALASGAVSRRRLAEQHRRILPGVYLHTAAALTPLQRARAVWLWSRGRAVLAEVSAAAVLGAHYLGDHTHACCIRAAPCHLAPRYGWLHVHQDRLDPEDVQRVRGMAVTSPARTAFDVARRMPYPANVEVIDQIYQATGLTRRGLAEYVAEHPGFRGVAQAAAAVEASDEGAESVWETRARMAVVAAGLPRPEAQVDIRDADGAFLARVDMCWPQYRVIFEYDGDGAHSTVRQRDRDITRWNDLTDAGYTVIRVRAPHLRGAMPRVLEQLRAALRKAGAGV